MVGLVLCAVDGSDVTARVLRHAVGLAAAMQARLLVVHAGDMPREALEHQVTEATPYGALYEGDAAVRVEPGAPVEAILRVADETGAGMIIAGTRARAGVARFLLGSTSAALLQRSGRPVLLIPPGDAEIVSLSHDRVMLHFGVVLAPVDLAETNATQLAWASRFAGLARQPLELMTVLMTDQLSDHDAASALTSRGRGLMPVAPHACIVRRGSVAEEIALCALNEGAGLVVMGLKKQGRGTPGKIASEVLRRQDALVLAVPGD